MLLSHFCKITKTNGACSGERCTRRAQDCPHDGPSRAKVQEQREYPCGTLQVEREETVETAPGKGEEAAQAGTATPPAPLGAPRLALQFSGLYYRSPAARPSSRPSTRRGSLLQSCTTTSINWCPNVTSVFGCGCSSCTRRSTSSLKKTRRACPDPSLWLPVKTSTQRAVPARKIHTTSCHRTFLLIVLNDL